MTPTNRVHEVTLRCYLNTTDNTEQIQNYSPEEWDAAMHQGAVFIDSMEVTKTFNNLSEIPKTDIRQHFEGGSSGSSSATGGTGALSGSSGGSTVFSSSSSKRKSA